MQKKIDFVDKILGSADVFSLEDRSLNVLFFAGLLIGVLSLIGDSIQGLGVIQVGFSLLMSIVFGSFYFFGRKKPRYRYLVAPFYLIQITVPFFVWYFLGGVSGSYLLFSIVFIFTLPILIKGNIKYVILVIALLLFGCLLIFEILHPDFVLPYSDKHTQLVDKFLTSVYLALGTFVLMNLLILSYRREQYQNKQLNDELIEANEELNASNTELLRREKLIQIKEEALANEQSFRSIFNSSYDGILIADRNRNIIEANNAVSKILGIPIKELKTLKTLDLFPEKYMFDIFYREQEILKNKQLSFLELSMTNRVGQQLTLEISTILMEYKNDKALLSVIRNITERKATEQEILKSVIKAEEEEKSRLAKEIHDGVGPLLSAAKIYADALIDIKEDALKESTINKLKELVNDAIITAKEISNNLSPHILEKFGLIGAIESFIKKFNQNNQFKFIFKTNLDKRLNHEIEVTFYRVVVELINNSLKYADANLIFIEIMDYSGLLALAYADDGKGFNYNAIDEKQTGMGLANIKSRINSLNGRVKIWSKPERGFKADIRLKTGEYKMLEQIPI